MREADIAKLLLISGKLSTEPPRPKRRRRTHEGPMLEADIDSLFVAKLRKRGMLSIKLSMPGAFGTSGYPDRLVIKPDTDNSGWPVPRYYFVELKAEKGKLTPLQQKRQAQLKAIGCDVTTVYGLEEALAWRR